MNPLLGSLLLYVIPPDAYTHSKSLGLLFFLPIQSLQLLLLYFSVLLEIFVGETQGRSAEGRGKASELGGGGDAKKRWKHSHRFLRLVILPGSCCAFLRLPELVNGLSLLLQLGEILPADLLSAKTTFLSSQL